MNKERVQVKEFMGYNVTNKGHIYNKHGRMLTTAINPSTGYVDVQLSVKRRVIRYGVHNILGHLFLERPEDIHKACYVVGHMDDNKLNNDLSNLKWITSSENNSIGKGKRTRSTPDQIVKCCELLQERARYKKLTLRRIANTVGVSLMVVRSILARRTHTIVSYNYKF